MSAKKLIYVSKKWHLAPPEPGPAAWHGEVNYPAGTTGLNKTGILFVVSGTDNASTGSKL